MELWIRSQDKQVLKIAECLDIYTNKYDSQIYYVIEESGTDMAQYKTKERALEVLDEIQNTIMGFENENSYVSIQCYAIYEMPEE